METGLSAVEQFKLGLSSTYYSVARALRLRKLKDLLQSAQIATDAAVWLLGECYGDSSEGALHEEALTQLVLHFQSIVWMTYRTHFTPIGDVQLRSDAGWGCTLRSGQMVLAQALQRHRLGRGWRWPVGQHEVVAAGAAAEVEPPEDLRWLLQLFWDAPSERNPLSIHNLCLYGRPCGVHPGKWLGPWVMCHTLAMTAAHSQQPLGVRVAVIAEPGGGSPLLSISRFEAHFAGAGEGAGGAAEPWQLLEGGREEASGPQEGLLLLVPLVLGLGKLNPVYMPQLQAVLRFPQSVGIVGGRPSSSLYFVGYQGDSVIYLDPHDMQPAACSDGDWQSFHCDVLRTMPLPSIDPSLALGFYCRDLGEYRDLCTRLADLERRAGGAPLLCVTTQDDVAQHYSASTSQWEPDEMSEEGEELSEMISAGLGAGAPAAVASPEAAGQAASADGAGTAMAAAQQQEGSSPRQPGAAQPLIAAVTAAGSVGQDEGAAAGGGEGEGGLPLSPAARQESEAASGSGWMPGWLKQRLPGVLGGSGGTDELEDMTLDKYAQGLKRARSLGGLTGWVHGTSKVSDPTAQGSLRMYENIIGAMTDEEKRDLSLFVGPARERVAAAVGCRVSQVDDCLAKYLWMKHMTSQMAHMRKQGMELPTSVEEVERSFGSWHQFKSESGGGGAAGPAVPYSQKAANGQPCPLAGTDAGRNAKCPLTRKAFKSCCGKKLLKG